MQIKVKSRSLSIPLLKALFRVGIDRAEVYRTIKAEWYKRIFLFTH